MHTFLEVEYYVKGDAVNPTRRALVRVDAIESIVEHEDGSTNIVFDQGGFMHVAEDFDALRTYLGDKIPVDLLTILDMKHRQESNAPDPESTSLAQRLPPQGIDD